MTCGREQKRTQKYFNSLDDSKRTQWFIYHYDFILKRDPLHLMHVHTYMGIQTIHGHPNHTWTSKPYMGIQTIHRHPNHTWASKILNGLKRTTTGDPYMGLKVLPPPPKQQQQQLGSLVDLSAFGRRKKREVGNCTNFDFFWHVCVHSENLCLGTQPHPNEYKPPFASFPLTNSFENVPQCVRKYGNRIDFSLYYRC